MTEQNLKNTLVKDNNTNESGFNLNRFSRKEHSIHESVTFDYNSVEQLLTVTRKKDNVQLTLNMSKNVNFNVSDDSTSFLITPKTSADRAIAGTMVALTKNIIQGLVTGYDTKIKLVGIGYKARVESKTLILNVGYSHPIEMKIPETLDIEASKNGQDLVVKGIDKQLVGQFSANICRHRPHEPYKGKGVKIIDGRKYHTKVGKSVS
jgi:large subunit ribosomal protein L6